MVFRFASPVPHISFFLRLAERHPTTERLGWRHAIRFAPVAVPLAVPLASKEHRASVGRVCRSAAFFIVRGVPPQRRILGGSWGVSFLLHLVMEKLSLISRPGFNWDRPGWEADGRGQRERSPQRDPKFCLTGLFLMDEKAEGQRIPQRSEMIASGGRARNGSCSSLQNDTKCFTLKERYRMPKLTQHTQLKVATIRGSLLQHSFVLG